MLIGNPSRFALECVITNRTEGYQFCHLRFFICNKEIGDFSEQTTLGVCLYNAEIFVKYRTERLELEANGLSASELFDIYYASLFDPEPQKYLAAMRKSYSSRFHLEEVGGESIREDFAILVVGVSMDRERVIVKKKADWIGGSCDISETEFPSGTVDAVIQEFLIWGNSVSSNS